MFELSTGLPRFKLSLTSNIEVGDIVQFVVEDSQVVLTNSDGYAPIGFATAISVNEDRITFAQLEYRRVIGFTDKYETDQVYPTNSNLYVSASGKFTTARPSETHPAVALVVESPAGENPTLRFMWF